ncbi:MULTISPECIES: hypothetical protein [Spiroplasma]|uniref:hypothetical protein n=1 Tax=Spiroplasma TaxID=2132 RepID=UPI0018DE7BDB|nr:MULTISPECIES: hypothetical protein [Spiroplasma]MBH8622925.1 hypothetical protein [Spiroplasma sp. hyd1]UNF62084.1 hypothetical protein MNU24_01060 [Spiroplasma poulsonii]
MRKILVILGTLAMSGSTILPSIVTNLTLKQNKLAINQLAINKNPSSEIPSLLGKVKYLSDLKIRLNFDRENILYFKDRLGNVFYEEGNSIYNLKRDWLSWPKKLDQIRSKVNIIKADSDDNVYFGTENGIYKLSAIFKTITKIKEITQSVKSLAFDKSDNIYIGTEQNVYYFNQITKTMTNLFEGWVDTISVDKNDNLYIAAKNGVYKLAARAMNIVELPYPSYYNENELSLNFSNNKAFNENWTSEYSRLLNYPAGIYQSYKNKKITLKVLYTFNLGTINPLNYEKLEFIGNNSEFYSKISWGNDPFKGKNPNEFNGSLLKEKILNKNLSSNNFIVLNNNNLKKCFEIQNFNLNYTLWGNKIWGKQFIILSYYFENGNYYLQFSVGYNVLTKGMYRGGGGIWMGFGHGLRLYND